MMRIATLFTLGCLMATTPVQAQNVRLEQVNRPASGIVESGRRAVAGLVESQPNATAQRGRRKGRIYAGLAALGAAGAVASVAGIANDELGEEVLVTAAIAFWGLIGTGIVLIATADSTPQVPGAGKQSRRTTTFVPTRQGGAIFQRITF